MRNNNGLEEKYRELQEVHNRVLHELADAAQIIKSYEYLEKKYKEENILLEQVLEKADRLRSVKDFAAFEQQKSDLEQAIKAYRSRK